jgi:para-nitrobenzyl esterase
VGVALEQQYLFPLYHGATGTPKPLNAAQERLSDDMVSYWTTFARTGNPNSRQTPFWPRYQTRRDQFQSLRLPHPVTVTNFAADHKCAFWERVLGPYQRAAE